MTPGERLGEARLCLLATARLCALPIEETVRRSLDGGVDVVQLREKELDDREFAALAARLAPLVRDAGALLILNDRARLAGEVSCDGVHLGQDDLSVGEGRRLVGPDRLVGVSTHDRRQVLRARSAGADYVGIGPVFPTGTKETGYEPLGPETAAAATRGLGIPAFAIGGIDASRLPRLVATGVRRVAVSSAICSAPDPAAAARQIRGALSGGSSRRT